MSQIGQVKPQVNQQVLHQIQIQPQVNQQVLHQIQIQPQIQHQMKNKEKQVNLQDKLESRY